MKPTHEIPLLGEVVHGPRRRRLDALPPPPLGRLLRRRLRLARISGRRLGRRALLTPRARRSSRFLGFGPRLASGLGAALVRRSGEGVRGLADLKGIGVGDKRYANLKEGGEEGGYYISSTIFFCYPFFNVRDSCR